MQNTRPDPGGDKTASAIIFIFKTVGCSLISMGVSAIALVITNSVATNWYVLSTGVSSLRELSDDYGFAMLLIFWYAVTLVITFPTSFYFTWKRFFANKL